MKLSWFIVTIILVLVILKTNNAMEIPDHLKKHAKKLHKRCQSQTNTPDEVIRSSMTGVLPKDRNFQCYIHCLFDIIGVMDENNLIHINNLQQVLPEEMHSIITKLSEACGTKEGEDKCNIAFNTLQCYADNNPLLITDQLEFLFD
ncbi:odorant-binding protein 69a [Cochliomyia hominivorax]